MTDVTVSRVGAIPRGGWRAKIRPGEAIRRGGGYFFRPYTFRYAGDDAFTLANVVT